MKKQDIKVGMIVELKNDDKYMVMPYGLVDLNGDLRLFLSEFNDDLTNKNPLHSITKVYDVYELRFDFDCNYRRLLWQREEPKPEFKVGDIVMIVDNSSFADIYKKGDVGVITKIGEDGTHTITMVKTNIPQRTRHTNRLRKIGVTE